MFNQQIPKSQLENAVIANIAASDYQKRPSTIKNIATRHVVKPPIINVEGKERPSETFQSKTSKNAPPIGHCDQCGKSLYRKSQNGRIPRFCSTNCRVKHWREMQRGKKQ